MHTNVQTLAERYVAVWNETDPGARRAAIAQLWRPEGEHFVGKREVRGYAELEQRVTGSHEKNVQQAGYRFRARSDAKSLHDVVCFHWEMLRPADNAVIAVGQEFLRLDADGRIACDYQFIVA